MIKKVAKQILKMFAPKLDAKIERMRSRIKREILEYIFSKSKRMKALFNYVHEPNELDDAVKDLKLSLHDLLIRVENLEKDSHPPVLTDKGLKDILNRLKCLENASR